MSYDCAIDCYVIIACNGDDIPELPPGAISGAGPSNPNVGDTVVYICTNNKEVYSMVKKYLCPHFSV